MSEPIDLPAAVAEVRAITRKDKISIDLMDGLRLAEFAPQLADAVERLTADQIELDGTDAAHPAYHRGCDRMLEIVCDGLSRILAGEPVQTAAGSKHPWDVARRELARVVSELARVTGERDALAADRDRLIKAGDDLLAIARYHSGWAGHYRNQIGKWEQAIDAARGEQK